jgi:hypothetical protein
MASGITASKFLCGDCAPAKEANNQNKKDGQEEDGNGVTSMFADLWASPKKKGGPKPLVPPWIEMMRVKRNCHGEIMRDVRGKPLMEDE